MTKQPQRKRGVRASRPKLTHALADAGLKTQSALAERIADIEDLESAPKDVVNRVFRELPVDPKTIERVARALNVDAHTLYKTADEEAIADDLNDLPEPTARRPLFVIVAAVIALALALGIRAWFAIPAGTVPADTDSADVGLSLGEPSLAVIPFERDQDGTFVSSLRAVLDLHFNVATPTADVLIQSGDPAKAAYLLRADVVIDGEFVTVGRLTAIRVHMFRSGVRQLVWSDSVPTSALAESLATVTAQSALAIRKAVGMPIPDGAISHFPIAPVQDDYLEGERYLDGPSSELNIKRAQSRFEAALRRDANYARAHAGLCQTLLEEHWMDSEERALEDASLACGQALQLAASDPVVSSAYAHFLSRTGRNDEAIERYQEIIGRHPRDAAALEGLAAAKLEAYRASGDAKHLQEAKAAAKSAADADPLVWKPLFSLASMEWFDGNLDGAIAASEAALARNENEFILANLGSFYLCKGSLDSALLAYARAQEMNPASYVGDEFLGLAHYFLGNFEESMRLRKRAIESVANGNPEIHQMWGNLGDAYRQAGERQAAVAAYLRAAEVAERDHLRGTVPVGDQAARFYYYTLLSQLAPDRVPHSVIETIDTNIDEVSAQLVSATALRRMSQTYLLRNERVKAQEALSRATASCPGYALLPDLVSLRANDL